MSTLIRRVFKSELEELKTEIENSKMLYIELLGLLTNARKLNDKLVVSSQECIDKYNSEVESHKKDIEEMHKLIELQKIYCYLIPRLINASGVEIPEDFDITDFNHAEKLYKRFRTGDLMRY